MQVEKARESLQAAELCQDQRLYNSTANRAYYAMFQAAVVVLEDHGFQPKGENWTHAAVPSAFAVELTRRRKVYPHHFAQYLSEGLLIRNQADYEDANVSASQAKRILRWAQEFVREVARP
jgi:uncharacterized protein (UPF0332 family)